MEDLEFRAVAWGETSRGPGRELRIPVVVQMHLLSCVRLATEKRRCLRHFSSQIV